MLAVTVAPLASVVLLVVDTPSATFVIVNAMGTAYRDKRRGPWEWT